jgi:hypothetical protein
VIISPRTDQSKAAFRYCKGIVESSPRLRKAIVKITSGALADVSAEVILLRRTDGHLVEIVVGAADAGGTAARSTTLLFAGFDEVAFFYSDDEARTVNDKDIFDAAKGSLRNIDGAQLWMCSTPWIEGKGLMEALIRDHWGKPGDTLVAARMSSYLMRGIPDDGSLREDTDTEESYRREILAIPLPPGSDGFFNATELERALLRTPPSSAPQERGAGGDFAFERDCSSLVIVDRFLGGLFAPVVVEERRATPEDLQAQGQTVRELGEMVVDAGVTVVMADHWQRTFVREHLHGAGCGFVAAPGGDEGKARTYGALKRIVDEGRLALGHLPRRVAEYVRDQLRAVVATPMPGPGKRFRLSSPRQKRLLEGAGAGRTNAHGDVASALVLAAWQAGAGREAASWDRPKVSPHATSAARREAALTRAPMGGSSSAYLRGQSASMGAGRPGRPARRIDDDD